MTRESGDAALAEVVASGAFDEVDARMAALCAYAAELMLSPAQ